MTTQQTPSQTDPGGSQDQTSERLARLEEGQRFLVEMVREFREEFRSGLQETNRRIDDNQHETNRRFEETNRRIDEAYRRTDRVMFGMALIGAGAVIALVLERFLN